MGQENLQQDAPVVDAQIKRIGAQIRSRRQALGWTLDTLASRANLSKSYMSRVEEGDRQPSIAAFLSICRALGVSLGTLLNGERSSSAFRVVHGAESATVAGNGLVYQVHSGGFPGAAMQPLRITISPNRAGKDLYRHDGEEWLYVLSGTLAVTIGDERHMLQPGDSLHFDAAIGHRLEADGDREVEAILVASAASRALLRSYI